VFPRVHASYPLPPQPFQPLRQRHHVGYHFKRGIVPAPARLKILCIETGVFFRHEVDDAAFVVVFLPGDLYDVRQVDIPGAGPAPAPQMEENSVLGKGVAGVSLFV